MKKAAYGFNAHRQQRKRPAATPEEKAERAATKSREKAEALAALARMQDTPAIRGKVTKLKRQQADAYARRNGMRPLKPPPVVIPPRTTTAAQRDAAAWNAGQIAPLIGLDFLTNAGRR